jgi:hypothetical protein
MMRRGARHRSAAPASHRYGAGMRRTLPLVLCIAASACGSESHRGRDAATPKPGGPTLVGFDYRDAPRAGSWCQRATRSAR